MFPPFRSVRAGWSPRRWVALVLALGLFAVECTARDEHSGAGGSAGSTSHEADGGAGAGSGGTDHAGEAGVGTGAAAGTGNGGTDHAGEAGAGRGGAPTGDAGEAGEAAGGVAGSEDSSAGAAGEGNEGGEAGSPGTDPPPVSSSGLPCEVETVLRKRCQSCHSRHPASAAIVSLMTYADLTAKSKVDPSVTVAARCLKRIKDGEFPMPPAPVSPATSEEIEVLEAWVGAGKPPGSCDPGGIPDDPYDLLPVCTSDSYWTGGTSGSPWMMPGRACITCHKTTNNHGPRFAVAGTLFPTAHEPDTCYGVPATTGAVVIITDANGVEQPPIPVSAGGNFFARWTTLAAPYRAKVVVGDTERVMLTPQTSGDCNACHTQAGTEGARGRIILP